LSGRREPGYPLDEAPCATRPRSPRLTALECVAVTRSFANPAKTQ
jgi:hypothetical protein